jgi:hypothetical protein
MIAKYLASNILDVTVEEQRTQATGSVGEIKDRLDFRNANAEAVNFKHC